MQRGRVLSSHSISIKVCQNSRGAKKWHVSVFTSQTTFENDCLQPVK